MTDSINNAISRLRISVKSWNVIVIFLIQIYKFQISVVDPSLQRILRRNAITVSTPIKSPETTLFRNQKHNQ